MAKLNLFEHPSPNGADIQLIGVLLVFLVLFFIGYLQSNLLQNFGTIYFDLTIISFLMIVIAVATRQQVNGWVIFGNVNNQIKFFTCVAIGLVAAYVLNSGVLGGFSIAVPLDISSTSTASSPLLSYIIVAFYGPIVEEIFWVGLLFTSMMLFFQKSLQDQLEGGFLLFAGIILFLGVDYIGIYGILLAVTLMVLCIIITLKRVWKPLSRISSDKAATTLILAAIFMTVLHVYSYGPITSNLPLFASAFLFFIIEGCLDWFSQSLVPSIIMHTTNNALLGAVDLGIAGIAIPFTGIVIPIAFVMIGITILMLWGMLRNRWIGHKEQDRNVSANRYMKSVYHLTT